MSLFTWPPITTNVAIPGVATEAKQDTIISELENINDELILQGATLDNINTAIQGVASENTLSQLDAKVTAVDTDNVTITSSVLPTGAATEATLSALDAKVTEVDTSDVTISSSALPSGAATEAAQDTGNASLASIDGKITAVNTGAVVISSSVLPSGAATAANQATANASLSSIDGKITAVNTGAVVISSSALPAGAATEVTLAAIETALSLSPVDQIDTTPLLDTSSTNIPASASNPVQVVASTAAIVRKVISVEDIGEFIGLYTGAAASETLLCVLPLGGGEVDVVIAAGTRLSLRNMKNAAISSGFIALNLLG